MANFQDDVEVAFGLSGRFVAVWESTTQDGDSDGVYAKRFAADGTKDGDEFG
jgi:hypothetical protein